MKTVQEHLQENETVGLHITELDQYPDADKYGLHEGTPAAQTLKDKTKRQPDRTAEAERLAAFMRLPVEHQKRALGLDDTDRDNDDWGNSYAARNRASHKAGGGTSGAGDLEMKKLKKQKIAESMTAFFPEIVMKVGYSLPQCFWKRLKVLLSIISLK
jgi:hypothetical protein